MFSMGPSLTQQAWRTRAVYRATRALYFSLCAGSAALAQELPNPAEFQESRPFSIPDKQSARAQYDTALEHLNAGRYSDAVTAIERLIEEHAGSVIALPLADEAPLRSAQQVYRGAADSARDLFAKLPPAARAAYVERTQSAARQLFARASAGLDTTSLADIARRFPGTPTAREAWFALGDIEAEAGNLAAARGAWKRARETRVPDDSDLGPDARELWMREDGALRASRSSSLGRSSASLDGIELPTSDSHHWEQPLRLDDGPAGPFTNSRSDYFNSFPIVSGDLVLASNSLTLSAADALTGRLRWRSAEHPGWNGVRSGSFVARDGKQVSFSDFFEGIDREGLMMAPAVGGGIAVAALQVPFTANGNTAFQNQIPITTVIPDRRLFAFDLETGALLWNHSPPPLWDCNSGEFTLRMRVAGPPVIEGSRVLVPMWQPQGRISYHVACYELSSGAYLWSTQVASGQRPLNMFGRLEREFCAPPLVVVDEKVIALTQLGAVAALDLFSGELLWETVYDQVALPPANGMAAGNRINVWRNAAPAVEHGVIVATPVDSTDMLGIDLHTGAALWALPASFVGKSRGRMSGPWCLLGVREDTVYLGGRYILALRAPEGLAGERGPQEETASQGLFGDGWGDPMRLPRAVLTERHVIVPTSDGRIALSRETLRSEDPRFSGTWGAWSLAGFGNLAVSDSGMFSLSGQQLCGILDWRSMEQRLESEFARQPDDSALSARLGNFLRERAASEVGESKLQAALGHLQRAETVLEAPANSGSAEARRALFECLRLEARALVLNAQSSRSLERLERAIPLAPNRGARALVLADIARNSRGRVPARFESALAELERDCGNLEFPAEPAATTEEATSVLRWVIEQRIADASVRGDLLREFSALVDLLDRVGDGPMSISLGAELPADRIERLLSTEARARAAWQPFEDLARSALEAANAAADGAALERLARLYPHTAAAGDARDARLRLALAAGDSKAAVRTAFEELPQNWSAQNSTPRQAQLAWLAARTLRQDGNPAFARSLLARLGHFQGATVADERDPTATFASLLAAEVSAAEAQHVVPLEANFDAPFVEAWSESSDTVLLGKLNLGDKTVFIVAARDRFDAIAADGTRLWTRPVEGAIAPQAWLTNALLVPGVASPGLQPPQFTGRVILTWRRGVLALDAATGEEAWSWSLRGKLLDWPLAQHGGVLTVSVLPDGSGPQLVGIELGRGTELWRHACAPENWVQPVVGSGLAVLLPKLSQTRTAQVLEIATGTRVREIEIGQPIPTEDRRGAWIEDGRLILPRFGRSRTAKDSVVAFDLESGARAWRVPIEDARLLDSIVRSGSETFLVYLVSGAGAGDGGLVELDTRIGAVRDVPGVSIGPDDLPLGLRSGAVTVLEAPYLFLRTPAPGGKETLVRSVHLPYGQRWAWRLKIAPTDLYPQSLPLPAVSSRLVMLAYTEERQGPARRESRTYLVSIDRESGGLRELRELRDFGPSDAVELATFGNLLMVTGKGRALGLAGRVGEEQR